MRLLAAIVLWLSAALAYAQPAAWRAHHPDHPGELLLLGSIHVLRASHHPLPERIDALFAEADRVVFELDLDNMAALQAELAAAAMLPPGQTLQSVLGPERYASAVERASVHELPLALLDGFQPWFVAISMTALGMHALGYRSEYGIEHHIRGKALAESKSILGLETLTDQIDAFRRLPENQQALLLEQALAELGRGEEVMTELVAAWEQGRLSGLREGLLAAFDDFPGLYARLIADRNGAWVERLDALARDEMASLVVVGALHLVGDDSLIELLRDRGFEVVPLR